MIDDFIPTVSQPATTADYPSMSNGMYTPPAKHRKPKSKKKLRKALKQAEKEREQLIYNNGRLTMENDLLKRSISLAVAVSRRQLDAGLSEDTLRLLPSKHKDRG